MSCTHERRRYWDCGCAPTSLEKFCPFCPVNSQCMACDELLDARPNILDQEFCSVCGGEQIGTKSGLVCRKGHGGAPTVSADAAVATIDDPIVERDLKPENVELGQPTIVESTDGHAFGHIVPLVRSPRRKATIARRPEAEADLSDSTCTPKWIADFLYETRGSFDVDPCSNPRSHIVSHWSYSLEKKLDGLRLPWRGSTFKNNPFSDPLPWQIKARYELSIGRCTELVELCKLDPGTVWWEQITSPIWRGSTSLLNAIEWLPDLWLFNKRVQYDEHPELVEQRRIAWAEAKARGEKPKGSKSGKSSNNFCSAMIHWRFDKPPLKLEKYATLWRRGGAG